MDKYDVVIYGLALILVLAVAGIVIGEMTNGHVVVGQVSDTRYSPQIFGYLTDFTEVTFYGGDTLTFKGNLSSRFEAGKIYTIKYHLIFSGLPFFMDEVISIKDGFDLNL